ncbi:MAG: hypothetical protein PWQ37_2345 [Candidatus Petromonas sp.]|jgi:hypothetical protein|nr:hypothetical protein [Candidatus Petromonas sp.]
MGVKRKWLGPGSRTSYKLPVIPGEEGKLFYDWLNKCDSINGTISEALKIKFMIDTVISSNIGSNIKDINIDNDLYKSLKEDVVDIEEIDMINGDIQRDKKHIDIESQNIDLEMIKRTFMSVKR